MLLILQYLLVITIVSAVTGQQFKTLKERHKPQLLTKDDYSYISNLNSSNYVNEILDNILIPRVVGTENHTKVHKYLINQLENLNWEVEIDEFIAPVPIFNQLTFRNIIATPNPKADRFLVLACHYDSKYYPRDYFVGATDSAVPCAMLLDIAKSLNPILRKAKNSVGLKVVFFDGEEAFLNWGPHDSIYGAKHLAQELDNKILQTETGEVLTHLDKIDVLVLLDLIGARNPVFYSHFGNTQRWFSRLANIEKQLKDLGLLNQHTRNYFRKGSYYGAIEDDHIPFLQRDVPILHLIATPFPEEWHTPYDNIDIIDFDTVDNLSLILKVFVAEYLHLTIQTDVKEEL